MPVVQFTLIIDGTQDILGVERESLCLHFVAADLQPKEFLGLYKVSSTPRRKYCQDNLMCLLSRPSSVLTQRTNL